MYFWEAFQMLQKKVKFAGRNLCMILRIIVFGAVCFCTSLIPMIFCRVFWLD